MAATNSTGETVKLSRRHGAAVSTSNVILGAAALSALIFIVFEGLQRSAWMDELFTYVYTTPGPKFLDYRWRLDPPGPVYYIAAELWRRAIGSGGGVVALRAFSAAFAA